MGRNASVFFKGKKEKKNLSDLFAHFEFGAGVGMQEWHQKIRVYHTCHLGWC